MSGTEQWSREKAIQLLNDCMLEQDANVQGSLMQDLNEILVKKDPHLIPEFMPKLLELQMYPNISIRRHLAGMLEDIGSKTSTYLPEIFDTLRTFLDDAAPAVTKRALTAGGVLYKQAFTVAAKRVS
jgi:hypothetical protein